MTGSIMFIAGEASGDAHAARVIAALRALNPTLQIFGAGGPKMQAAGMDQVLDLTEHAVVGLVEVLKNYGKFKRIFDELLRELDRRKPAALVLVDFPGFNLRFARAAKERSPATKIIYYISPQLWAWHASRARQIERDVDLMLTIFPFEKDWYAQHAPRLKVEFVGHPLVDSAPPGQGEVFSATGGSAFGGNRNESIREVNLVLLLPGSREREVSKIFPVMAGVVEKMPVATRFVAVAAADKLARLISHPRVEVQIGGARDWMQRATVAITASGTATMECAFHRCPTVVVYKVNWLTYLIGRALVQVNWLAMPNVIAGRQIVPEFIQHAADPARIAASVEELLRNEAKRAAMQRELDQVIASLGNSGASERAARLILESAM